MAKLKWDQIGERTYETGVDRGVLYPQKNGKYPVGVAWNGLISISENPSGAEDNALYADNIKYLNLKSAEDFGLTVECYTYPDEWAQCNGEADLATGVTIGQQSRNTFGLCYRTKKGNDTEGSDYGYKLHLVYACSAAPSDKSYESENDSPSALTFSYEVTTTPIPVAGKNTDGKDFRPSAVVIIDSTLADKEKLAELEEILYGNEEEDARLPLPDEIKELFAAA